jgi:hypothetical protein
MGEIGTSCDLDLRKYHIGFWKLEINIKKYWIEIESVFLVEPVQFESIEKLWFNIFRYKIPMVLFW